MDNINTNNKICNTCELWKNKKLTHRIQEDGIIAPPVMTGVCYNIHSVNYNQITENVFSCNKHKFPMLFS